MTSVGTISTRALLASVGSRRLEIRSVTDRRIDTARIGSKPDNGKNVVTLRPVTDVVRARGGDRQERSRGGHGAR